MSVSPSQRPGSLVLTLLGSAVAAVVLVGAALDATGQSLATDPRAAPPSPPTNWKQLAAQYLRGYELAMPVDDVALAAPAEHRMALPASTGVCYAAAAYSPDIADLDIRVYLNDRLVQQDVRPDAYPVAEVCADADGTLEAVVRAHDGDGEARVALFVDINAREAAGGTRDELSNRLDAALRAGAARWRLAGDQWRHTFTNAGVARVPLTLDGGLCHTFAVVGQAAVEDVDVRLRGPDDAELARDFTLDATAMVTWCTDAPLDVALDVAVPVGSGTVAMQRVTRPFDAAP